jgi:hypothetical protein
MVSLPVTGFKLGLTGPLSLSQRLLLFLFLLTISFPTTAAVLLNRTYRAKSGSCDFFTVGPDDGGHTFLLAVITGGLADGPSGA